MSDQRTIPTLSGALRIGDWLLVPATHTLSRDGQSHRLPRRLVDLLRLLAARPGGTWSREELLAAAWSRRVVNDEVLSRAIAELRGLLGDDARTPRYIETLPKTGYRLLAPVTEVAEPGMQAGETSAEVSEARRLLPWTVLAGLVLATAFLVPTLREAQDPLTHDEASAAAGADTGWVAADIARAEPFRSGVDWARQPRYSRDGRWLVYVVGTTDFRETWLEWSSADGSAPRRLETGDGLPAAPVFSPDGSSLAFTAWGDGTCRLRVLQLPAGAPRTLADCAGTMEASLDWPAPQRLLFTGPPAAAGQGEALWQVDPGSGHAFALTAPPAEAGGDSQPREAADGNMAFLRGRPGQQELWLRAGGSERRLVDGAHRFPGLAWTQGGAALLAASDLGGFPALHWIAVDTGETRLLGARGAATLDLSPDGGLLYEQRRYDANLWAYGAGEPRQLTDSTRYEAYAAVSRDGRQLLYVSNRDGNGSIWTQEPGGAERRLALPPASTWVRPQWLGDTGYVLLTRYVDAGETRVEVFDPVAQRLLDQHPLAGPGFAAVTLDAQRAVVGTGHGTGRGMQLVLRDASGDHVIDGAAQVDRFHSDGRWIGWTRLGDPELHLFDPSSGARRAMAWSPDGTGRAWTLHGGELFVVRRDAAGWSLWRQRVADGEATRWLALLAAPTDGQVVVDGNGRAILSHVDAFASDLLHASAPASAQPGTAAR